MRGQNEIKVEARERKVGRENDGNKKTFNTGAKDSLNSPHLAPVSHLCILKIPPQIWPLEHSQLGVVDAPQSMQESTQVIFVTILHCP